MQSSIIPPPVIIVFLCRPPPLQDGLVCGLNLTILTALSEIIVTAGQEMRCFCFSVHVNKSKKKKKIKRSEVDGWLKE